MVGLLTMRSCCFHCNTPSIVHKYIHNYMLHSLRCGGGVGKYPIRITENRSCKLSTANKQLLETQSFVCCAQSYYNLGAGVGKAECIVNRRTKWVFTFTLSQLYPWGKSSLNSQYRKDWVATGKFLPYRKSNVGRPSRHLRTGSRVMLRCGDANIRRPAGVALVEAWEGLWLLWRPPADPDAYRAFNQFGGQSLQHVGFQWGVHYLETSRGWAIHVLYRYTSEGWTELQERNWTHTESAPKEYSLLSAPRLLCFSSE
jgi:hypothetical protein